MSGPCAGGWVGVLTPETSEDLEEIERRTVRGRLTLVSPSGTAASSEMMEKATRIRALCERYHVSLKAAALQFILAHPALVSVMPGMWSVAEVMARQMFPVVDMDDTGTIVLWKHGTRPCPHGMRFVPVNERT